MANFENLTLLYGDKIARRCAEFKCALELFVNHVQKDVAGKVTYDPEAAEMMALTYFAWLGIHVKPYIKDLCDRYKVASLTEYVICYLQPMKVEGYDGGQLRLLNADFAFFCSFNIMENFRESDENSHFAGMSKRLYEGANARLEDWLEQCMENHKRYLSAWDSLQSPAVISNAHTLELLYLYYNFRWQALAV